MAHQEAVGLRKNGDEFAITAMLSRFEHEGEPWVTVDVRDVTEERRIELAESVLADLGDAWVAPSHEAALHALVQALVRRVAEFAVLFVFEGERNLKRVASASRDPRLAWAAERMLALPEDLPPSHPVAKVLSSKSTLAAEHDPTLFEAIAQDPEHLRALQAAAPRSTLLVPLLVASDCVGLLGLAQRSARFDESAQRLEEEVARRSALFVENERLHRAERRALELRDEVLGVVAHDLRHPLNAILLSAHSLRRRLPAEQAENSPLSLIRSEGWRMNRMIDDLLDVATLDAGLPLRLRLQSVSPGDALRECVERHRQSLAEAQQLLDLQLSPDLPKLQADRDRLAQVLDNLLSNAIRFAPPGSHIGFGAASADGEVVFRIHNDGEAIAPEALSHVFDRLWQARSSDRRGRGLGLFIVKSVVTQHGGSVSVDSTPGKGTTFRFTLPLEPKSAKL